MNQNQKNKIKPVIRLRQPTLQLLKECSDNQVIVRGSPDNIRNTINRKLNPYHKRPTPYQIVGRVCLNYLFWKFGNCHLSAYCSNTYDFYSSVDINKIPICFQFFTGNTNQAYGYDIRSLIYFRESGSNFRNPYTDEPFTSQELDYLQRKTKWLKRFGYPTQQHQQHQQHRQQQQLLQYTINVFSILNEHQYVDYEWFTSLRFNDLRSLYRELHEIWYYRLPMQETHKANMVNSVIFSKWEAVRNYKSNMEDKLRLELLQDIEKLITEGINEDYRKNGCYIFLLGLVLVSEDAATSHPSMFQAAYRDEE